MTGKYIPRPAIQLASYQLAAPLFHALLFVSPHLVSSLSLASSTIKNWFHVHQPFVVKMGNQLSVPRLISFRLMSKQSSSARPIATHFNRSHSTTKRVISFKS